MNRVNKKRDTKERPVTWHRENDGEAREGPLGDLARKHDILALRWTQWLTSQWGQAPDSSQTTDPTPTSVMPDAHLRFDITYKLGTTDIAPYQPWPEKPSPQGAPNTAPAPSSGRLPPQPKQGARGKNSLGRKYLSSDENDDAVEKRLPKTSTGGTSGADSRQTQTEAAVQHTWTLPPPPPPSV